MSEQLALFGAAKVKPTDRLFFALLPGQNVAARMGALRDRLCAQYDLRGQAVADERLHLTVQHIDDYEGLPLAIVRECQQAGAAVASSKVPLLFDRLAEFVRSPQKPLLVLKGAEGSASVLGLQQKLATALNRYCPSIRIPASYTPHVSLFYGDRPFIGLFPRGVAIEPFHWLASELVLVHSLLGRSQHKVLARWPFSD